MPLKKNITKQEVSAKELVCLLDEYATDVDHYEFGLPVFSNEHLDKMVGIVQKWLNKRRKYDSQQLLNHPY